MVHAVYRIVYVDVLRMNLSAGSLLQAAYKIALQRGCLLTIFGGLGGSGHHSIMHVMLLTLSRTVCHHFVFSNPDPSLFTRACCLQVCVSTSQPVFPTSFCQDPEAQANSHSPGLVAFVSGPPPAACCMPAAPGRGQCWRRAQPPAQHWPLQCPSAAGCARIRCHGRCHCSGNQSRGGNQTKGDNLNKGGRMIRQTRHVWWAASKHIQRTEAVQHDPKDIVVC